MKNPYERPNELAVPGWTAYAMLGCAVFALALSAIEGVVVFAITLVFGLVGVGLIATALAVLRRLAKAPSHQPAPHCLQCGYCLVASTDRCPECGEPVPTSAKSGLIRWYVMAPADSEATGRLAVAAALNEARSRQCDYLGTEHLLVGIIETAEMHNREMAEEIGVDLQDLRGWITQAIGSQRSADPPRWPCATPAAERAFACALESMVSRDSGVMLLEDLLAGVRRQKGASAWAYLEGDQVNEGRPQAP